jgi:hypothetical protein
MEQDKYSMLAENHQAGLSQGKLEENETTPCPLLEERRGITAKFLWYEIFYY